MVKVKIPVRSFPPQFQMVENPAGFFIKESNQEISLLIVKLAENDWYGLIPNFDFPCRVFLQFQIVEKTGFFFLIKSFFLLF